MKKYLLYVFLIFVGCNSEKVDNYNIASTAKTTTFEVSDLNYGYKTKVWYNFNDQAIDSLLITPEVPLSKYDRHRWHFKYNLDGLLIEETYFEKRNISMGTKKVFTYNSQNLLESNYMLDDDGTISNLWENSYDSSGNQLSKRWSASVLGSGSWIFSYDSRGNRIGWSTYGNTGIINKKSFEYDSSDNLLWDKSFDREGKLTSLYEYKYDNKGNRIETAIYNDKPHKGKDDDIYEAWDKIFEDAKLDTLSHAITLKKKYNYKYDIYNNMVEESEYDSIGNLVDRTTKKYNISGKLLEEFDHKYGEKQTFVYDSSGVILLEKRYYTDSDMVQYMHTSFEYEYDANQRLIGKYRYYHREEEIPSKKLVQKTIHFYEDF